MEAPVRMGVGWLSRRWPMIVPAREQALVCHDYVAHVGYRAIDARRYERRRYGGVLRRLNRLLLERALDRALCAVPRGSLVLDAPSGTGIFGARLAARGYRVVGLDISPAMIALATGRGPVVGQVRGDLEQPPFARGAFAAVVCVRFLMHLPEATRPVVLRKLAELSDGPLVATVCHPYTLKSATRRFRRLLGGRPKRSPRLTRAALTAELDAAGLRLERLIPVLPVFSEVWVAVAGR